MYPGSVTLGSEEDFWVWETDSCKYTMTPDGSLRAYRDSDDKIIVNLAHYDNYRLTGTSFDNLTSDCNIILSSNWNTDPSKHDSQHWLGGGYTEDGINVHALVHNENWSKANDAASGDYYSTSIVYYSSSDGGATWTRPTDYVVYSESDNTTGYSDFNAIGHVGVEAKSNIIKHDGYYYTLLETNQIEINNGRTAQSLTYIIRTDNLSDPNSWRGWDGTGYNVVLGDRYNETINTNSFAHLNKGTVWEGNVAYHNENLLYSDYFEKFMIVGFGQSNGINGVYYTLSDDLIHWSQRILVKTWDSGDYIISETDTRTRSSSQYRVSYAGVIDHNSSDRNFSTVGQEAYLYWTENQPNGGAATCPNGLSCGAYERKIKRQQITFTKREVSEFIVDGAGDLEDTKQGDGIATTSSGKTSLRSALLENRYRPPWATNYVLTIKFNLPTSDKTITPGSNFLEPEWPFILDGTTESGYVGNTSSFSDGFNFNPVATIDGESGIINLKSGNSEIKGMDIFSVTAQGNSNKITNSIIQILNVEGKNNTIGIKGSGPNLIYRKIVIKGDSNTIQGNYVGTNKAGSATQTVISHSDPLIGIQASYNTIDNNLVALLGGSHDGIEVGETAKYNTIKNNYVGIKPDGSTAFATSGANGIEINGSNATNNTIENNVIGGNQVGVNIMDANNNEVYSNKIGIGPSNENLGINTGIWINGTSSSNTIGSESKPNNIQNNTTGLSFLTASGENNVYANTIHSNTTNIFNDQATDFTFHSIGINSSIDTIDVYLDSLSSAVEWIEFYGSDSESAREGKVFSKKIIPSAISNLSYSLPKNFDTNTYPYLTTIVKKSGKNISNYNESKKILSSAETPQIALSTTSITEDHSSTTNTGVDMTLSNNGNYPLKWYVTGENEHSFLEPDNGTVDASSSTTVNVTFDSRELPDQDTSFVITFKSNDISSPKKDLTVAFEFVDDTNRTPVIADQSFNIDENSANSTWIGAVVASDPDGDDLTFSIQGGTGVGTFAIDNLGNLSVANSANLDYEVNNSLFIGVVVSDGTESAIATITVNINDVVETGENHAPVIADQTFSVDENVSNDTWIEAVVASDPDGDDLTFSITGGTGENTFKIDNLGNLSVKDNTALDYETNTSLTITIQVSDGLLSSNATITININDINDNPSNTPPEINDQTFTVEENVSNGTGIGSVIASDADGDDLTFSITGGSGSNTFNVDNDGNLAVSDNSELDYETNTSLTITVQVSDGNASDNATMTINITDVDEATPTVTLSVDNTSISEAAGVATITATIDKEPSSGDVVITLTADGTASSSDYTLNSSSITISSGKTGTATITAVQDTEDEDDETIIVDVSSVTNGSESGTQQVTITITDDDDDVVSGIENESLMKDIVVYPNPVNKSTFYIDNNSGKTIEVIFYSTTGKRLLSKKLKLGENRFSTKKFTHGIQHIIFTNNSKYVGKSKIIIKK